MEKVDIKIPKLIKKTIKFGEVSIKVKPIIEVNDYAILIKDLRDNFFIEQDMSEYIVKLRIKRDILSLCTNVNIDNISNIELESKMLDDFINENIINYNDVVDSILCEFKINKLQTGFGLASSKIPTSEDVDKMLNSLKDAVNGMDTEKLNTLFNATVYNKSPLVAEAVKKINLKKEE